MKVTESKFKRLYQDFLVDNYDGFASNIESWVKCKLPKLDSNESGKIIERIRNKFINDNTHLDS